MRVVNVDHLDAIITYHPLKIARDAAMEQFKNVRILKESGAKSFYKGISNLISKHINNIGLDLSGF